MKCLPGFLRCVIYLPTQFKSLRIIIPKCLQLLGPGNFWVTKGVTRWIFNPSSRKSYFLTFTGVYFHPILYPLFPEGVQIVLQISM